MSCDRCASQAEVAMGAAGVPVRQTQATWAVGGQSPQCPACGAFTGQPGACVSPRCALQRLLDCPALHVDDLEPETVAAIDAAQAALARADAQAAQALSRLLDCPALNPDDLEPETVSAIEAAQGIPGVAAGTDADVAETPTTLPPGDRWGGDAENEWWKSEEWKGLRGQLLEFARDRTQSDGGGRISLTGFSQRRVLPRGCWLDTKVIRGHGPYLYLRWRVGSRQRSKYLGKGGAPTPSGTTGAAAG